MHLRPRRVGCRYNSNLLKKDVFCSKKKHIKPKSIRSPSLSLSLEMRSLCALYRHTRAHQSRLITANNPYIPHCIFLAFLETHAIFGAPTKKFKPLLVSHKSYMIRMRCSAIVQKKKKHCNFCIFITTTRVLRSGRRGFLANKTNKMEQMSPRTSNVRYNVSYTFCT